MSTNQGKYDKLLQGNKRYGKAVKDGVEISGTLYEQVEGRITDWDTYHYRWTADGTKEVYEDASPSDIRQMELKKGATLTFDADGIDEVTIDLPVSGYVELSKYAEKLINRGLTLETVVTRISSMTKSFGKGRRQPCFSFELVRVADNAPAPVSEAPGLDF